MTPPRPTLTPEEEEKIAQEICDKHNVDPVKLGTMMIAIMALGLGRNSETSNLLRGVADFIDCPISSVWDDVANRQGRN